MWNEISAWQETLTLRPDLSAKTITLYTQDVRRFATWLQQEHAGLKAIAVTPIDAKRPPHLKLYAVGAFKLANVKCPNGLRMLRILANL